MCSKELELNTIDKKFAYDLLKETGVGVIPGSSFGPAGNGYIRIALTQPFSVLKEAINVLRESRFNYGFQE